MDSSRQATYTKTPNDLMGAILKAKLTGGEFTVIMAVMRFSFGFHNETPRLSNDFLAEQIGMNESQCRKIVKKLIGYRILTSSIGHDGVRTLAFVRETSLWSCPFRSTDNVAKSLNGGAPACAPRGVHPCAPYKENVIKKTLLPSRARETGGGTERVLTIRTEPLMLDPRPVRTEPTPPPKGATPPPDEFTVLMVKTIRDEHPDALNYAPYQQKFNMIRQKLSPDEALRALKWGMQQRRDGKCKASVAGFIFHYITTGERPWRTLAEKAAPPPSPYMDDPLYRELSRLWQFYGDRVERMHLAILERAPFCFTDEDNVGDLTLDQFMAELKNAEAEFAEMRALATTTTV